MYEIISEVFKKQFLNMYFLYLIIVLQIEGGYDFLTIIDGTNDQSTQTLSGNLGSFNVLAIGNYTFVKFTSDWSHQYNGFLATIHYGKDM